MPFKVKAYRFPLWWTYNSEWQPHISLWKKIQQRETARTDSFNQAKIHFINDQRVRVILPSSNNEKYELLEVINDRGFSYYYHLLSTTKVLQNDAREYIGVLNIYMTYVSQLGSAELAKVKCRVKRFLNNYLFTHYYMTGEYWRLPDEMFDYKNEPYGLAYDDSFMFSNTRPLTKIGINNNAQAVWNYENKTGFIKYRVLIPKNVGDISKIREPHNNILNPINMGEDVYGPVVKKELINYTLRLSSPALFCVKQQRTKVVVYQITGIKGIPDGTYACFVVIDDANDDYKNPAGLDNEYLLNYPYFDNWLAAKVDITNNNSGYTLLNYRSHVINYNEKHDRINPPNGTDWNSGYSFFLPSIPKLSFFVNSMNNANVAQLSKPTEWATPYWSNKLVGVYDLPLTKLLQMKDLIFYGMKPVVNRGSPENPSIETYDPWKQTLFVPTFLITPSEFKSLTDTTENRPLDGMKQYDCEGLSPLIYKGLSESDGRVWDYRTRMMNNYYTVCQVKNGTTGSTCDSTNFPQIYNYMVDNQWLILPYPELENKTKKLNVYCISRSLIGGKPTSPYFRWNLYDFYYVSDISNNHYKKLTWVQSVNYSRGLGGGKSWLSFNGNKFIASTNANNMSSWMYESRGTNPVATNSYNEYIQSVRSQVNTGIRVAQDQRDFAIKKADIQGGIGIASGILGVAAGIGTAVATGGVGGWGSMSGGLGGIASSAAEMELSKEQARMSYRHNEQQLAAQMVDKYNSSTAQNIVPSDVQDVYANMINNTQYGEFGYRWCAPQLVYNYAQSINPNPAYNIVERAEGWFCWTNELTATDYNGYAWISFVDEEKIKWPLWTEVTHFPQSRLAVDHYERLLWKVGMKGEFIAPLNHVLFDKYYETSWTLGSNFPANDLKKVSGSSFGSRETNLGTYYYWNSFYCLDQNRPYDWRFDTKFHYASGEVDKNALKKILWSSNINAPQPEWLVDGISELIESGIRIWYVEPSWDNTDRFAINAGYTYRVLGPLDDPATTLQEGGTADLCSSTSNDSTTSTRNTRKRKSRQ